MKRIIEFFTGDNNNIEKNIEEYAKKEKIKQQKSKVLGQKPTKGSANKDKKTNVHNSSRV